MSLPSRLLGTNPSIQVSTLLSGSLSTPSAKQAFTTSDYESIASYVVGSGGASSVSFSTIPTDYKHLQIRVAARHARTNTNGPLYVQFNNDTTASNYPLTYFYGNGNSSTSSYSSSFDNALGGMAMNSAGATAGSNIFTTSFLTIHNYQDTSMYKHGNSIGGVYNEHSGDQVMGITWAVWKSLSAITSIQIKPFTSPFSQYSEFALYGLKG